MTPRALLGEHQKSFYIFFCVCVPIIGYCCLCLDSKMTTLVVGCYLSSGEMRGYHSFSPLLARCHEIQGGGRIKSISSRVGTRYVHLCDHEINMLS